MQFHFEDEITLREYLNVPPNERALYRARMSRRMDRERIANCAILLGLGGGIVFILWRVVEAALKGLI